MNSVLQRLVSSQDGMVARRQLTAHGVGWDHVHHQVVADRWVIRSPRVISTFTGTPTTNQLRWLAVLHAGPRSMLGGLTAAAQHGLEGWERATVTVLVDDELSFEPVEGVHFFRSRRPFDLMISPKAGIPRCRLEPALLLWAGYDAVPRAAHGVLAASIQQRLTTPERMVDWVDRLRPLRRAKPFKATLSDIAGGSHSGAELDIARMCRRFRMPQPSRQVARTDRLGRRRWTDAEWDLPDGSVLVLEVDGSFHTEVLQWHDDLRRTRQLVTPRRLVVRCSAYEIRHETVQVALDLMHLGVPGRVPGTAA
ncbi:hypothetical protein [Nocardioides salsibiostraticola]